MDSSVQHFFIWPISIFCSQTLFSHYEIRHGKKKLFSKNFRDITYCLQAQYYLRNLAPGDMFTSNCKLILIILHYQTTFFVFKHDNN